MSRPPQNIFQTTGKGNLKQVFGAIFNAKAVGNLMPIDFEFSYAAEKSVIKTNEAGGKAVTRPCVTQPH